MFDPIEDLLEGLVTARRMFLKHLVGLREDQWDWRPYRQCFSIRQTLRHLVLDDRAALNSLQTGNEPDYDALRTFEHEIDRLYALLSESHENLLEYLRTHYGNASPETEICVWGRRVTLLQGIAYFASEDFYHMGQVSFIRQASDPTWNYYEAIYGITYPAESPNPYP